MTPWTKMISITNNTLKSIREYNQPITIRELKRLVPEADEYEIRDAVMRICMRGLAYYDTNLKVHLTEWKK